MLIKLGFIFSLITLFSLVPPFLIQFVVDYGIENKSINFVLLLMGAQLMLFLGIILMNSLSNWLVFYVGKK